MRNRCLCVLLCAALLAALSGCGTAASSGIPADSSASSVTVTGPSSSCPAGPLRELSEGAVTSAGYYFIDPVINPDNSATLMYLDFATSTESPLCSSPGCTHSGAECTANLPASGCGYVPLLVGERLVLLCTGASASDQELGKGSPACIEAMEPDGSGRTPIICFETGQELFSPYITDGEKLYCTLHSLKNGNSTSELVRIDLRSGETDSLYKFDESWSESLVGACDGYFLLSRYTSEGQMVFLRLDASSLQCEELLHSTDDTVSLQLDGATLYYLSSSQNALHMLDCSTLADTVVPLQLTDAVVNSFAGLVQNLDGHILLTLFDTQSENAQYLAIDTAAGQQSPFTLMYSGSMGTQRPVPVISKVPGQEIYLVETGDTLITVPSVGSDGSDITLHIPRPTHALISVSDYWNSNPNYTQIQAME